MGQTGKEFPKLTIDNIQKTLTNPFYAIEFDESLFGEHPFLVTEETWIAANVVQIQELGAEKYLKKLLEVLKGKNEKDKKDKKTKEK